MAALPLLTRKGEDEEGALKRWLGYAFYAVTLGLMLLNVSGAWIGSNGNLFYTGAIAGAELFVALALGALIYTRNNLRFGVGVVVFLVGVYITLENGKMAVTHAMSNVFVGTPAELIEKADLADKSAATLETDETAAKTDDKTSLSALREEMAALKVESQMMQAQSKEGILKAQIALKARGDYRGPLDGIREELTEGAMEVRGEQIATRMAVVQAQIDAFTGVGAKPANPAPADTPAAPADTPSEAKRKEAILLRKQATEVSERTVWMTILLIGLEGIRSLALWVFLMDGTMSASRLRKKAYEQLKLAEINVEIAEVNAKIAALQKPVPATVAPASVEQAPAIEPAKIEAAPAVEPAAVDQPPPAPESETLELTQVASPAPEMTDLQRRARAGGLEAQQQRRAAKTEKLLVVGDWEARDAQPVPVAAE